MNLDFWSILMIVFFFHGLFLLSTVSLTKRRQRKENRYLSLLIICLIWYLLEFFLVRNRIDPGPDLIFGTRYGSWFLFGPLAFFYFKAMTQASWKFGKADLLHFLPFAVITLLIPSFSDNLLNHRQVDYGMLSVFDHREKVISPLQYFYSVIFIAQFAHLGFYLFKNLKLVRNYREALSAEYSNINGSVRWLRLFNLSFLVVLVFAAVFLYVLLVTDIYRRHMDYLYVLPIGTLFYIISYYLINTEWKASSVPVSLKYAKSSLDMQNIDGYVERLNELMKVDKVYLDNELRLTDLAEKMELNAHHLSQLINQQFESSFFDFINKHRIEEAKKIIEHNPDYTLLQVAFDAGFNNKTSFVNSFKKFEKSTPSEYRRSRMTAA